LLEVLDRRRSDAEHFRKYIFELQGNLPREPPCAGSRARPDLGEQTLIDNEGQGMTGRIIPDRVVQRVRPSG
jgi:hypothetical protein